MAESGNTCGPSEGSWTGRNQLCTIGTKILPSMMRLFETLQPAIGSSQEDQVLRGLYEDMPVRSFSTDILEEIPHRLAALHVHGVTWSDWSRPERIVQSLHRIAKVPAFQAASLRAPQGEAACRDGDGGSVGRAGRDGREGETIPLLMLTMNGSIRS